MQHEPPSPPEAGEPGGHGRTSDERSAVGLAQHVEDHHFEHPTVSPVSPPATAATQQW